MIEYGGVLVISDGRFKLDGVFPISELKNDPDVWSRINTSPDFPTVARSALSRFRDATGRSLDGVIAADPIALQEFARATGPVRERGYDVAISSQNAAQVLMHDVFEQFEGATQARHRYTSAVVERLFGAITEGIADGSTLLSALQTAAEAQHLKVYSRIDEVQSALGDLGITGDPHAYGSGAQMVIQNSLASSKVDFFLRRKVDVLVHMGDDDSARVTTTVTVENRAPDGPASRVLGFEHPGLARLTLGVLLPEDSTDIDYEESDGVNPQVSSGVADRRLFQVDLSVPPGTSRSVSVGYEVPSSSGSSEEPRYEIVLVPKAVAFPDIASVKVVAPSGFCVDSCDRPSNRTWERTRTLTSPWRITTKPVPATD